MSSIWFWSVVTANTKFAVLVSTTSFIRAWCEHRDIQCRNLTGGPRPNFKICNSFCKDPSVNKNLSTVNFVLGKEPAGYGSHLENPLFSEVKRACFPYSFVLHCSVKSIIVKANVFQALILPVIAYMINATLINSYFDPEEPSRISALVSEWLWENILVFWTLFTSIFMLAECFMFYSATNTCNKPIRVLIILL